MLFSLKLVLFKDLAKPIFMGQWQVYSDFIFFYLFLCNLNSLSALPSLLKLEQTFDDFGIGNKDLSIRKTRLFLHKSVS